MASVDLNRLKTQLASAKVRETDYALFQMLNLLIDYLRQDIRQLDGVVNDPSGGVTALLTKTYLTVNDETGVLINSRQLLAGDGIIFDDSVFGERTVSISEDGIWVPLSDGDPIQPEVIFDSFGQVVMVFVPNP